MSQDSETIVISLGGSVIVPGAIQINFLKKFREFILNFLKEGKRFIIVAGGGAIARNYQQAADEIIQLTDEDKDWLGIHATRLNAHLLRTIFKKEAYPVVLDSPHKPVKGKNQRLFIASGWLPGWSTDYDAVLLAKRFKATKIINASDIDYIYDKNPDEFKDAKLVKEMKWSQYLKIAGKKWIPGMKVPFDPIASKVAKNSKMTVIFTKGTDLKNLAEIIKGNNFNGTTIHP